MEGNTECREERVCFTKSYVSHAIYVNSVVAEK